MGMPLLRSRIHRGAVIDFNRGLDSIHPDFITGHLKTLTPNPDSRYAPLGLGLVRTHAYMGSNVRIRPDNPTEQEILEKVYTYWQPYHRKIHAVSQDIFSQFGIRYHISCHSFPMEFMQEKSDLLEADVILGTRKGQTASPAFTAFVAQSFREEGFSVIVDKVLSGAECVRLHGHPEDRLESIQIELTREMMMNNHSFEKNEYYDDTRRRLMHVVSRIKDFTLSQTPHPILSANTDPALSSQYPVPTPGA
jgi:N-formylglutamate deformylase